ncbi:sigma-70 family RNA polymerase sigma factor [Marilutibacter aestuarii]
MGTIIPFQRTSPGTPMSPSDASPVAAGDEARDAVPWEQLMARAQDGERQAYHALLSGITPYVRAVARRYLGHPDEIDDAVQDILVIVHGIRHTYERGRPFKPWLGTIASRRCIDLLRRRTHRVKHEFDDADALPEAIDHDAGPADQAARAEAARALHEAIEGLPARQREAVQLLRIKELSLSEAAARSQQSTGALKVAYHRALKSLRRVLGPEESPHD